jgi:DedD protein
MIRLPNFLKSKKEPAHMEPSFGAQRTSVRRAVSSNIDESTDLEITEDPEKQKARHRLLGAALMVLVAIIGLPKVFDSQPKKVSNDVVLQMVASVVDSPKDEAKKVDKNSAEEKPSSKKDEVAKTDSTEAAKEVAPAKSEDPKKTVEEVKEPKDTKTSKTSEKALSQGEEVVEDVSKAKKSSSTKYTVNIGAFSSADRAKKWSVKLKEQKIPYFTQEKKKDDETLYMLRSGPFSDRSEAEAAEKKIRAMGLTPKIVESK